MTEVKKVRQKKLPTVPENSESVVVKEKKPRASRAKKVPTKQEAMSMLLNASNELKQVIQDLKDDQMKLSSMPLKKANELLKESISNIEEDLQDILENYEQLKLLPEVKPE
jgi:hypothetical protein